MLLLDPAINFRPTNLEYELLGEPFGSWYKCPKIIAKSLPILAAFQGLSLGEGRFRGLQTQTTHL